MGANSRLGAYSNKYGTLNIVIFLVDSAIRHLNNWGPIVSSW